MTGVVLCATQSRAGLKAMLGRVAGTGDKKKEEGAKGSSSSVSTGSSGMTMMDVLENTLWSRKLGERGRRAAVQAAAHGHKHSLLRLTDYC